MHPPPVSLATALDLPGEPGSKTKDSRFDARCAARGSGLKRLKGAFFVAHSNSRLSATLIADKISWLFVRQILRDRPLLAIMSLTLGDFKGTQSP